MPSFSYRAMTVAGQDVSGVVEAADRAEALRELVARGTCVTELAEKDGRSLLGFARREGREHIRIRQKQVAILTRQLATSLEAGLPLMSALHVVGSEMEHAPTRELLQRLGERVQEGASFSDALGRAPQSLQSDVRSAGPRGRDRRHARCRAGAAGGHARTVGRVARTGQNRLDLSRHPHDRRPGLCGHHRDVHRAHDPGVAGYG